MFRYYIDLALRSLKRHKALTALMILTIGFGVAASMTTWSVLRAVSGDPIPWKSSRLYVPQIDMWGPSAKRTGPGSDQGPPDQLDYPDAIGLMRDHRAKLQSAMYQISPSVVPQQTGRHPLNVNGEAVYSEFFPMVDAPFEYGSEWSASDDANRAQVAVISDKLNHKVFGGGNSVGKAINIDGHDYRVAGVLKRWNPQPLFYDVSNSGGGFDAEGQDVFIPFQTAVAAEMNQNGNTSCYKSPEQPGFAGFLHSTCIWIAYMVQLDSAADAQRFKNYLEGFAHQRYPDWAPSVALLDLPHWLDHEQVVPPDTRISMYVALGLLLVCLVNTAGLLLAKFLRRSSEIGVRRALGAPRMAIYAQFLTEGGIIGLAGGLLGLLLTWLGVLVVGQVLPKDIAALVRLDVSLLITTLVVAVLATLLASLYPTFRASRVQPAWQLKSN